MQKECVLCGKKFVAKRSTAKFCSGACKLKANRMVMAGGIVVPEVPGKTPGEVATEVLNAPIGKPIGEEEVKMTATDKLFEADRPDYYKFGEEIHSRTCLSCGKGFSTRLDLNKFCSPDCKNLLLSRFTS